MQLAKPAATLIQTAGAAGKQKPKTKTKIYDTMGKWNFQKIGFGVHGGGEPCGPRRGGKVEYTPEEVNALLDKLAAIMEKGGGGSQPMDLSGVELTKNKREFIRPYKEKEQGGNFADHDHYASERAVAEKLYLLAKDIESLMDADSGILEIIGNLDYFDEEAQFPEGLLPEQFNVSDVLKALHLYIKMTNTTIGGFIGEGYAAAFNETECVNMNIWQVLKLLHRNKLESSQQITRMQQQINELAAKITGVTISVSPESLTVGETEDVVINITTSMEADSVSLYRNGTRIYRSAEAGTSWEYTDENVTPEAAGEVKYKAVVVVGHITKENEVSIPVQKQTTNIHWSEHTEPVEATIGAQNTLPELQGVTGGMDIFYRSSNEGVADIDANGVVTLIGAGTTTITASFAGDATREGSQDSYELTVVEESHLSVQIGSGVAYQDTLFTNTGLPLTNGMHLSQEVGEGDYLFIKIDKRQSIDKVMTYNPDYPMFDSEIEFDAPVIDGDYKYYKSTGSYRTAITSRITILT